MPALDDPDRIRAGAGEFNDMCVACHGGPGAPRSEIGLGLMPQPPDLSKAVPRWSPQELFWILKHGVKMSGMPAFGPTHDDDELWAIVAFLLRLPALTPADYRALAQHAAGMSHGHGSGHSPGSPGHGDHAHHDEEPTP